MSQTVVNTRYVIDLTGDDDDVDVEVVVTPTNSNKRRINEVNEAVKVKVEAACGCGSKVNIKPTGNGFGYAYICDTCVEENPECGFCVVCKRYQETNEEMKCGKCEYRKIPKQKKCKSNKK